MGQGLSLAVSIGVPLLGGALGGFASQKDVLTWYQDLKKPKWTPPSFVFGPAWTVLYIMQGTASWFVWKTKSPKRALALGLYGGQLALNLIWNPLFFKTHKTDVALADITVLLGLATAATVIMSQAHEPAVQLPLMVPYLAWVTFAAALNASIYAKNPTERLAKGKGQRKAEDKQEQDKKKPASTVKEAAAAAKAGVKAAKAAGSAYGAGREAGHHVSAAVAPVVAAKDAAIAPVVAAKDAIAGAAAAMQETVSRG